jgi:4-carboxymuconolactone decarboxylase
MSRVKFVNREDLRSEEDRQTWDRISQTRGGINGPYSVLMRLPDLAKRMAELGDYFRHDGVLAPVERELAILAAAREMGSHYEWHRHEPIARELGARRQAIEAIRTMSYSHLTVREVLIIEVVQTLFRVKYLPLSMYQKATAELGEEQLIELVTLTGFYCSIAFILLAFEVAIPDGSGTSF